MLRDFEANQQGNIAVNQQEKKKWEPKEPVPREKRLADIEKSKVFLQRARAQTTTETRNAWNAVLAMKNVGPACALCTGKGHTLFKCPSYLDIKSIKKGMPVIGPIYGALVAEEMIRINTLALDEPEDQANLGDMADGN